MSPMHGQCLLQDSRPCCTIAYTENYLIVILVFYCIPFFLLSEGNKTKPCSPHPGSYRIPPKSLAVAALQNFLTERCVHFLPPCFLNFGGGLLVWVCFLFEFPLRQSPPSPSEMLLMWKRCQQTAGTEHLFPAARKHVWKCSCQGEEGAVCVFCCCGSLILSETFTHSPQEP